MSISENKADPGITARIVGVVAKLGGQKNAGDVVGISQPGIRKWVNGDAKASFEGVAKLARAAGVSLDWIATGTGAVEDTPLSIVIYCFLAQADGSPERQPFNEDTLVVHPTFFVRHRLDPQWTGIVRVAGNAMAPTLPDGTLAIIDMRVRLFQDDGIYVIGRPNGFVVRRVSIHGERADLKTDNPAHGDTYAAPEDMLSVPIWGRVALVLTRA